MFRPVYWFIIVSAMLAACKGGDKKEEKKDDAASSQNFKDLFTKGSVPYQLSDTALVRNTDTTSLPSSAISSLIPDSIKRTCFGKATGIKYTPLVKLMQKDKEGYYLLKAASGVKKAVFILVFDAKDNFKSSYPFLLPDADPATSQVTTIDKNFTITKSIVQRSGAEVTGEGKEVVAYDAATGSFSLIMTDVLNDNPAEIINPIDTFAKTNKWAGDYKLNKKNIVSVRDGRHANQLLVYIHTENEAGDCKGELKGEFLLTSGSLAVYRLGGDPCVLDLNFSGNTVSIKEESGCGNHRGLDCPLSGTFTKKKLSPIKQILKKGTGK